MELPKNQRRTVESIDKKTIWLYGQPFSGKTYLANQFPDPLMLNTDGNIKFVDAPYIAIKDVITVEGRMTKRQFAWEILKNTISELEKKQNDFKTIVVDLIEDTYEACRLYMYDQLGITHESDDSFRAWDKVRIEFLSTIKRLVNLDYENIILISHEDSSKDLTKKSGDKITSIKPNLQDKAALKIAGMVDIVARVIADDDKRTLNFKNNEVIFGGGRLSVKVTEIPCDYEELMKVYAEFNVGTATPSNKVQQDTKPKTTKNVSNTEKTTDRGESDTVETAVENVNGESTNVVLDQVPMEVATAEPVNVETPEKPKNRTRKARTVVEDPDDEVLGETEMGVPTGAPCTSEPATTEEAPTRRRRKRTE